VIKHETGKSKGSQLYVQYCALPITILEEVQRACEMARIVPVSVQPAFVGLIKLLMRHQSISEHPSVFLHIGNESTTMGIYDKAGLRTINLLDFGFRRLLQSIIEGLECDESTATQALFHEPLLLDDPGASDAQNEIPAFAAIETPLADFLQKIYGQLLLFGSEHPEENGYSKIVVSGEGALIKNLDRLITFNLGIPASVISNELKDISELTGLPADEMLETLAPALGSLLLQPARKDRFDRIMAA
jgi:Tfp pilus assembly PilM family ATPase